MVEYDVSLGGIAALVAFMLFLTTTTLGLRLAARYEQRLSLGLDDYCAIAAWLFYVGMSAAVIYCMTIGFIGFSAPKNRKLTFEIFVAATKSLVPGDLFNILALGFTRLSALFFYRRIFCTPNRDTFNILTIIFISLMSLWTVGFFFSTLFACGGDVSKYWAPNARTVCVFYAEREGLVGTSFALDLLVLLLPLPKILALHASPARKVALAGVFALALIGVGASCARMVIYVELTDRGTALDGLDSFEASSKAQFYALLEAGICLITVSLPSIWYFVGGPTSEKVLRSVRGLVSLRSTRSSDSVPKNTRDFSKNSVSRTQSHDGLSTKRDEMELS